MSRPNLANEMGMSKQSILNLIDGLIEKGFLKKDEKTSYLKTTRAWDIVYFFEGKESLPVTSQKSLPHTGKESLPNNNTFNNNSLIDIKESCCFEDFWKLYGKNIGKKPCEKIWKKIKLPERKIIFEKLPAWKEQFTNSQFYPNPETFLQDERWNDEITQAEVKKIESIEKNIKKINISVPDYWSETWYISNKHKSDAINIYFEKLTELGYSKEISENGRLRFFLPKPPKTA